jgi:signal transduction histidine kinase/ligand-binding sensor domain-containing protein
VTLAAIRAIRATFCAATAGLVLAAATGWASTNSAWLTRSWQTDEGLPNNYVTAIAQSEEGFLWVGTPAGLLRFDGVRFAKFSYRGTNEANADQGIHAISSRRGGGLWIAPTRGQLVGFDANFSRLALPTNNLPRNSPLGFAEDLHGGLWVAYPNAICQVNGSAITQLDTNAGAPPGGFTRDSEDNLWMVRGGKVGIFQNGDFHPFGIPTTTRVIHLAAARTNGVWIGTGTHLFKCNAQGDVQDFGSFQTDNQRAESWTLMEDHAGAVWIGTDGSGLFRRDDSGFEKIEISHPYVLSLAEDREGNIWAGTAGGGLNRISASGLRLEGLENGSSLIAIQSICEDTNATLWGATQNGLLVSRRNGAWDLAFTNQKALGRVTCVAADRNGAVWIGTRDRRFHRWFNGKLTTWTPKEGLAQHTIVALLAASNGDLWISEIGNPNAIQRLDKDGVLHSVKLPPEAGRVCALAEDVTGRVWAGSANGMLLQAEEDRFLDRSSIAPLLQQAILCLYATPDGALWIGFEGGGVGRIKDGHFARITPAQGLFDDHISEIIGDNEGWLWFGCERGIFKIHRQTLESVMDGKTDSVLSIHYGRNEGLFSVEASSANVAPFTSPRAFRSSDGNLWMPMRKGVAAVNPKILRESPEPPPVLLTGIVADGRAMADYGDSEQPQPIANLKDLHAPLKIPAGTRKLDFEFTALNFAAPENVLFRYRLQGLDDDWLAPDARSASYTRPAPGGYQFHVQASNGNGPWRDVENPASIIVLPYFWQTWTFRGLVLAVFTLCVVAAVRYVSFRRLRTKLKLIEQQAALDKERARIARDLHDDLGCSLTQVALTLDMTNRKLKAGEQANGKLEHCTDMVRQVAHSVDEIVWAINPRNDSLRYVIDYVSQFAVEFLHAADITCRVELPETFAPVSVSPEARHNLFLAVKEALNNITRHAQATEVRLNVTLAEKEIRIVIEDNGRGFEHVPDNASADGLRNMRQRMEEIQGRFELNSRPGAGTRISLVCPYNRENLTT